ncbi:MAG: PEP-CTERM sorting domain-containing protein [Fimbriimonadaceae bacterium]|nr:PEP-CTERM sorting domain-containing protein [Fimbriimonadaceae bacterium]QYK56144.1 MAG: PEP-CTERM sorting domain-containing protein [Fimbriimonadaceae bacterium]
MHKTKTSLVVLALGGISQAQTLYAVAQDRGLYSIDVSNAAATKLATLSEEAFGLHIWAGDGSPYAGTVYVTNGAGELKSVLNLQTGQLSDVLYTLGGGTGTPDLDFGNDPAEGDALVAATDEAETGFVISPPAKGPIKKLKPDSSIGRAMAFGYNGTSYYTLDSTSGGQKVFKTSTSGNATEIGALSGAKADIDGVAWSGSAFYGLDVNGGLYSLDLDTAKATYIGDTKVVGWRDGSFGDPVPEPATLLTLAAAVGLLGRRRKGA